MEPYAAGETGSTNWGWRKVKIGRPAGGQQAQPPKATFWRRLSRRNPRQPITVSVKLRGGAEQWVEVKGRGGVGRYPGYTSVIDIILDINNCR